MHRWLHSPVFVVSVAIFIILLTNGNHRQDLRHYELGKIVNLLQWRNNERHDVSNHQPRDCSSVYSGADQRNYQSSASLAFVWGIHRWPVNSPHKGPVTRKMFPFDDVIMRYFIRIHQFFPIDHKETIADRWNKMLDIGKTWMQNNAIVANC